MTPQGTVAEMCRRKAALNTAMRDLQEAQERVTAYAGLVSIGMPWHDRLAAAVRGEQLASERAVAAHQAFAECRMAGPLQQP